MNKGATIAPLFFNRVCTGNCVILQEFAGLKKIVGCLCAIMGSGSEIE